MEELYRVFVSPMVEAYRLGPMQIGASMGRIHSFYLGLKGCHMRTFRPR